MEKLVIKILRVTVVIKSHGGHSRASLGPWLDRDISSHVHTQGIHREFCPQVLRPQHHGHHVFPNGSSGIILTGSS